MILKTKTIIIFFSLLFIFNSCKDEFLPKPRGYFRISLPQKSYQLFNKNNCNYTFQYPKYSIISQANNIDQNCWYNMDFPLYDARIHLSYKSVNKNINDLIEETRSLAYKHSIKADAIEEKILNFPEKQLYGILYDIRGNAASSTQFFLTDSTSNFFRGALYFSILPNTDSIAPVLKFIQEDIDYMINSFEWQ